MNGMAGLRRSANGAPASTAIPSTREDGVGGVRGRAGGAAGVRWAVRRLHASEVAASATCLVNFDRNKYSVMAAHPMRHAWHYLPVLARKPFALRNGNRRLHMPPGKQLRQRARRLIASRGPLVYENGMLRYRASKFDCDACSLKPSCSPNAPARKILRSIHKGARDTAKTDAYLTS